MSPALGRRLAIAALPALLCAACDYGGLPARQDTAATPADEADAGFHFAMVTPGTVGVRVEGPSGPVAGARVIVHAPDAYDAGFGDVVWMGMTDQSGLVAGRYSRRAEVTTLEVTVDQPGWRGPYSEEAKRSAHGPFAPAAWLQVKPSDLGSLKIALTPEAP